MTEGEDGGEDVDQGANAEHVPPEQDAQWKLAMPTAREEIAGCRRLHKEIKEKSKRPGSDFFSGVLAG